MTALQIIVSILMFAVVLVAIQKKFHPVTTLLAVGVVVLVLWGGIFSVTGAETTTGSFWLDAFQVFQESSMTYIASTGLTVMSVLGYVSLMDHLHATDMFAYYLSTPLKKVKNPYLVGGMVVIIGVISLQRFPPAYPVLSFFMAWYTPLSVPSACLPCPPFPPSPWAAPAILALLTL